MHSFHIILLSMKMNQIIFVLLLIEQLNHAIVIDLQQQLSNSDYSNYFKMKVTIRKTTRQLISNFLRNSNLQYILELENSVQQYYSNDLQYIKFSIVDDSIYDNNGCIVVSQRQTLLNTQEVMCRKGFIEEVKESVCFIVVLQCLGRSIFSRRETISFAFYCCS